MAMAYSLWSWWLPLLIGAWFLGSVFGWYEAADVGAHSGKVGKELIILSLRGLVVTIPAAIVGYYLGVPEAYALRLGACGMAMGLVYLGGNQIYKWTWLYEKIITSKIASWFGMTDIGAIKEAIFGIWIGIWIYAPF